MPMFKPKFTNGLVFGGNEIGFNDSDIINFLNVDGDSTQTQYISAERALQNSDIYSIVFQMSSDLATSVLTAEDERMQAMLDNPNEYWTNAHAFWQCVYAQLLLGGESFVYRWRNANGTDKRWEYLRPGQVSIFALEDYSGVYYNVTFDSPEIGVVQNIPARDMLHFRLLSQNGGATGVSPLASLADELQVKNSSNRLTLNALKQSILAPGVLKVDSGLLNAKQKSSISQQFMNQVNDSNGGPIVIDKLADYTQLEIKSDISKLLAQTDWTSNQIAKAFGVPNTLVNGNGDQQSSLDMIANQYARALTRYSTPALSEMTSKLSTKVTLDIKPALDPLNTSYTSNIATFQQYGMLSPDEAKWLLKNSGYLPENMPDMPAPQPVVQSSGKEVNQNDNN